MHPAGFARGRRKHRGQLSRVSPDACVPHNLPLVQTPCALILTARPRPRDAAHLAPRALGLLRLHPGFYELLEGAVYSAFPYEFAECSK